MVGVPGRSRGCNTCKQRKVSCGQEKPECRTCLKAGRVCLGYQRERIFLFDPRTQGEGPNSYRKPKVMATQVVSRSPRSHQAQFIPQLGTFNTVIQQISTPSASSMYRQQMLSEFLSLSVISTPQSQHHGEGSAGSWLAMLPQLSDMTRALEVAIMAMCTGVMGRNSNDPQLIHEGLKLYAQGLRELQAALWSPRLMYRDETCAACIALVFYEILECPDQSIAGWMSHMKGCIKLVQLKGPNAFTSNFGHQVFVSFRIMEVQLALTERRHTFLAGEDWIHHPWKDRKKTSLDHFIDILVGLPNAMADGTELLAPLFTAPPLDPAVLYTKLNSLLDRAWDLDGRFAAFIAELEKKHSGDLYSSHAAEQERLVDECTGHDIVFPVAFHFKNLQIARLCMMQWAATAILWSGMTLAYSFLAAYGYSAELPALEHRVDRTAVVKNICQSIEYCLRDEHRSAGETGAIFPLKVAIETLHGVKGCEREFAWAMETMLKISGSARLMKFTGVPWVNHDYVA